MTSIIFHGCPRDAGLVHSAQSVHAPSLNLRLAMRSSTVYSLLTMRQTAGSGLFSSAKRPTCPRFTPMSGLVQRTTSAARRVNRHRRAATPSSISMSATDSWTTCARTKARPGPRSERSHDEVLLQVRLHACRAASRACVPWAKAKNLSVMLPCRVPRKHGVRRATACTAASCVAAFLSRL